MKQRLSLMFLLVVLLIAGAASVQAQDTPAQINSALADLSTRLGRTVRLEDLDTFQFVENRYTDTALGCALVTPTSRPEGLQAYTFTLVLAGTTYDYRVSLDGSIVIPCSADLLQVTFPTPVVGQTDPCPADFAGFLSTRLVVNGRGRVISTSTPSRIRSAPSVNAEQLGMITPGGVFDVIGGPSCGADGFVWYQVSFDTMVGWSAEGALPDVYYLEPVSADATALPSVTPAPVTAAPTSALIPTLTPVGDIVVQPPVVVTGLAEFAGLTDQTLTLFDLTDAELVALSTIPTVAPSLGPAVEEIAWSPDGTRIAYTVVNADVLELYVSDATGAQPVLLATELYRGMPVSFTADGQQVVYVRGGQVFTQALTADAQPTLITAFDFGIGCGGGSSFPGDTVYEWEAGYGGRGLVLELTPFGLVHSTNCTGSGTALLNLQTGESAELSTNLSRVDVSADGSQVVGISDEQMGTVSGVITIIDLSTMAMTPLGAVALPDQLTWGPGGDIFYSTRTGTGEIIPGSDAPEVGFQNGLETRAVSIHRVSVAATTDAEIYTGTSYAIGRLMTSPDGTALYFTTIPNGELWVQGIVGGTIDPIAPPDGDFAAAFAPALNRLNLATGTVDVVASGIVKATLNEAAFAAPLPVAQPTLAGEATPEAAAIG